MKTGPDPRRLKGAIVTIPSAERLLLWVRATKSHRQGAAIHFFIRRLRGICAYSWSRYTPRYRASRVSDGSQIYYVCLGSSWSSFHASHMFSRVPFTFYSPPTLSRYMNLKETAPGLALLSSQTPSFEENVDRRNGRSTHPRRVPTLRSARL